ncbi:MAG: ATP-binding protein [Terriglobia bacterium]
MNPESHIVEVSLESKLQSVETAEEIAEEVCAKAGFNDEDLHKIGMAVHESVINAIWHGNHNDASKRVWLRFQIHPDRLEVHIRDQGSGFEPGRIPDPLESENLLKVSGRGIFLIRSFVDEFRVENLQGQGTEVTLVKRRNSKSKKEA